MSKPTRIQRKRIKGWKMSPNTVYVGRPSKWGNPFYIAEENSNGIKYYHVCNETMHLTTYTSKHDAMSQSVKFYEQWLFTASTVLIYGIYGAGARLRLEVFCSLPEKNLCCWCPLDQPCHADILLKIANEDE